MPQPVTGVGLVVFRGSDVLLVKRGRPPKQGQWSLPGGKLEWGETLANAALRELAEETSITAEIMGLIDTVDLIDRDETGAVVRHYALVDFAARWTGGEPVAGDDASDARFWSLDSVDTLGLWEETVRIIQQAWEMQRTWPKPTPAA